MISKSQAKFIRSLHLKKEREIHRQFIAEGSKIVLETAASTFPVSEVYALQDWIEEHGHEMEEHRVPCETVTFAEMEHITALSSPSPALAVVGMKENPALPETLDHMLTLVLDGISDPGNLGTIIRIADWFGIRQIVCAKGTVELYNPKVIQATMGSFCRVEVYYTPLAELFARTGLPKKVYGTFLEGKNIYHEELSRSGLIVIGNESRGISHEVAKFVTDKITIPSYSFEGKRGHHAESLNAAVAVAVVCAEFRRRTDA